MAKINKCAKAPNSGYCSEQCEDAIAPDLRKSAVIVVTLVVFKAFQVLHSGFGEKIRRCN
jgi:hypothetical protein